jgi:hypothetical protein
MSKSPASNGFTIPEIALGSRETIWDLSRWLYRGAAGAQHKTVYAEIQAGRWGVANVNRIELVRAIHAAITSKMVRGGARATARNEVIAMNSFVQWIDGHGYLFELHGVVDAYMHWTDSLVHDAQVRKIFKDVTAYSRARAVGIILDIALERRSAIIRSTRLKKPGTARKVQGTKSEKQNLEETFAFGHLLQDICDGITLDALWGPSPLRVPLSGGGELLHYSGRPAPPASPSTCIVYVRRAEKRRERFDNDKTLRTRYPIANMRILAELLTFIAQTGMNLAQAHQLTLCHFSYASDVDGYKVRSYKARRGGEVLFEIFREYRSHFERYLAWRRSVFPTDSRLFPVFRFTTFASTPPCFIPIQKACRQAGVCWIPPRVLRSTRINWLLRRSGDPDLTAEMVQHHRQTLLENYETPSLQRVIGEVTRFWRQTDPHLALSLPLRSIAPGECDGAPREVPGRPRNASEPDCIHASGCLWCDHHRDIDSHDYVWALSCFRHLKILEMGRYRPALGDRLTHPAGHAIDRISKKLTWFRNSNSTRRSWVEESLTRVEEGYYHPEWERLIASMEDGEG